MIVQLFDLVLCGSSAAALLRLRPAVSSAPSRQGLRPLHASRRCSALLQVMRWGSAVGMEPVGILTVFDLHQKKRPNCPEFCFHSCDIPIDSVVAMFCGGLFVWLDGRRSRLVSSYDR